MMEYQDFLKNMQLIGKDPSKLIFEDDLTSIFNRRFLLNYFQNKVTWNALKDHPLSLIMMDLDRFKKINDTFGHPVGDQVLIWVAGLLKDVAGQKGFAIRYAGDEFMILLPHTDKQAAMQVGESLLKRTHEESLSMDELDSDLKIAISMGVASAPEDAQNGQNLIQKADTALYYAKKAGGDLIANAGEVIPEKVFAKTAIYQLEGAKIVGREQQLTQVVSALKKFGQRQNQFLILEGAAGMGKSEFLEMIRRYISRSKIWQVKVNGVPQEMFNPYYLTANIIMTILNQREDKGAKVFEELSQREVAYLAQILPQLGVEVEPPGDEDERTQREGIFNTLLQFIPKILDHRPIILFIDDLHFGDEATLVLLLRLMMLQEIPIFICSTSMETKDSGGQDEMVPLEKIYATYHQDPGIQKIYLTALTDTDIANHIQRLFPDITLPVDFEKDLAQITQGNPLFLGGILRKLVLDEKISLKSQNWVIEPVEEGYLPKSLEEIVSQKITALDEESRQLLDHFSIMGEGVSMSALVGSSNKMETKVQEFVDQAVVQGLISKDFQLNDETVRFLGKRILEITYQAIQPDRKQEIHEQIGNYQESLYKKHLLPSAATLAYHFKRSANQESAKKYEQLQTLRNSNIFNAQEAINYTGDEKREQLPKEAPLDPTSQSQVPSIIRHLLSALRNIKLYPPGSQSIIKALQKLKETIAKILENNDVLSIVQSKKALMVNGQEINATELKFVIDAFLQFLNRFDLKGIAFQRGVTEHELEVLLQAFGKVKPKMIDPHFWQRFSSEKKLTHISVHQVRYTMVEEKAGSALYGKSIKGTDKAATSLESSHELPAGDQNLDREEVSQIPEIIRSLIRAARTIKLYPQRSKSVSDSVTQFLEILEEVLSRRPVLALAHVSGSLLVNGARVETSEFNTLAQSFMKFLGTMKISSLTFLQGITVSELEIFLGELGKVSPSELDEMSWMNFAKDHGLSGIIFNQHLYKILDGMRAAIAVKASEKVDSSKMPTGEAIVKDPKLRPIELPPEDQFEAFLEKTPAQLSDLLLRNDEKQVQETIRQLFQGFQDRDQKLRQKVIAACRDSMEGLSLTFQYHLAKFLSDPLLAVFSEEEDLEVLENMGNLLRNMALNFIQSTEHPLATLIFSHLQRRRHQFSEDKNLHAQMLAKVLDIKLDQSTQKFLMDDLKSSDPHRQRNAAQMLDSLGQVSMPLLIDIIKQEDNFRIRKIAASLLEKLGPEAANILKQQLVLESNAKERSRILEIVDSLTKELKDELPQVLSDENPNVRNAAFELAERLNNSQVAELLLDYARNRDIDLATAAFKSLGKLKPPTVVGELISILNSTKEEKRLIVCCRTLGQFADPTSIEPLAKILTSSSGFFRRKKSSALLRATAAFTLGQISHPRVKEVLGPFVNDSDPRIRQIAQTVTNSKALSPS